MKFVDIEQGSEQWHQLRRTKIGASNSPALLGLSPYKNAVDVFEEMVLGKKPYINKAMQRGTDTEAEAREYFNDLVPGASKFIPRVVISEEYDLMMASLDGLNELNTIILEIKVPGKKVYDQCINAQVPIHWEYQIQHQLAVTGLDLAYLFVYMDANTNLVFQYKRDEKRIAQIVKGCEEFEKHYLLTYQSPESDDSKYIERSDDEWENTVTSYLQLKKDRISLESTEKLFHQKLIDLCEEKPSRGFGIRVERSEKKGLVDYSLIEELQGINLEQYRKPAKVQWRICETDN